MNIKKILSFAVIPVLITVWFYVGEPQFFGFPPKAEKAEAAISYTDAGTAAFSSSGGTTVNPSFPSTVNAGDLLVLILGMKPSTANSGSVITPDEWTSITSITGAGGYGSTLGADTGNTNLYAYYKIANGSEDGSSFLVRVNTNNVSVARIFRFTTDSNTSWSVAGATGTDDTAGTSTSIQMSSDPGVVAGDYILGAMIVPTDSGGPGSRWSGEALSQDGVTFGTVTEIQESFSGNGNDLGAVSYRAPVSEGVSAGVPTFTATVVNTGTPTFGTNARGPGIFLRVRGIPQPPTFYDSDGINEIAFNNIRSSTTTPNFVISSPYFSGSSTLDRFQLEINTSSDFSGTAYTQTFTGTYASGTQYALYVNSLSPSLPTTDGVTYYVRARVSANGGIDYSSWSTSTRTITYKSSGEADWFQTTKEQFETGNLDKTVASTSNFLAIQDITGMYFTNFSEYATGSTPNDWTQRWATSATSWIVRDDATAPGGKVVRVEDANLSTRRLLSWNVLDSISADGEIFFMYSVPATTQDAYIAARASGVSSTTAHGMRIGFNLPANGKEIANYNSGSFTRTVSSIFTPSVSLWYKARASFIGTALKYKSWLATDSEPASWSLETTDSTISGAGWIGFANTVSNGTGASFGAFGVNINGGSAPTSPISTSTGNTIISPTINFNSIPGVETWGEITWSETETNGTVSLQVYYATSSGCNTLIPDAALSGNSAGFSSGPIDISGLSTTTYANICLKAILFGTATSSPRLNDWSVSWAALTSGTVGMPSFYESYGTEQIAFNNIAQSTTTPLFRLSATSTTNFNRFQVELNTAPDFSGTAYTQTFSGTYASGTQYSLYANSLSPSLPATDGITYYVRARVSANSGTNYGNWSTETRSFTYKSSGSAEWFQTTDKQFQTGTISNATTSGSGSVYAQSFVATGGSTSTSGGYKYHIFNTSGTFSVTSGSNVAQVLVVAGGGGGGSGGQTGGGGGGAGGLVYNSSYSLSVGDYTVTVGNGGAGGIRNGTPAYGVTGDNSVFGSITALGGGGGKYSGVSSDASGGSGGAGSGYTSNNTGGAGTVGQGNNGGNGVYTSNTNYAGGGGGGSGSTGSNGSGSTGGNGGAGSDYSGIFGTGVGASGWFAGGGGGAGYTTQGTGRAGGSNGSKGATSSAATANTGSGGGGATGGYSGGAGGSGFVGLRYLDTATGTIMSPQISFSFVPSALAWDQITWSETETNGTVSLQVYYATSSGCNALIPDAALSGNSAGFSSGPIDISGLSTSTYANICLKANLNYSGGTLYLNDWKVSWGSGGTPSISQLNYRWRNDDGGEVTATYAAATNTAITTGVYVGDRIRLRFQLSNAGTGNATGYQYRLEYASMSDSCSSWTTVPAYGVLGPWSVDSSPYIYENLNTTDSTGIANPAGKTFLAGYAKTVGNQTLAITLNTNEFTEIEYSIRSLSNVTPNVAYCFRTTNAGSTSNFTYTVRPEITVLPIVIHTRGGNGYNLEVTATSSEPTIGGSVGGGTSTEPVSPVAPTTTSTSTPGQGGGGDVGLLDGRGESMLATVVGGFFENYLLSFIKMVSGFIRDLFNVVNTNGFA